MRRIAARSSLIVLLLTTFLSVQPPSAVADHAEPALNAALMDYSPIGYYGPPDEAGTPLGESAVLPTPGGYPMGPPFVDTANPSGKWVAYDTNVWESLSLPSRHPGDNCNSLPPAERHSDCREGDQDADGDGPGGYTGPNGASNIHGLCPPQAEFISGECFNNQLEYLDYYENAMETELADFGATVKRYGFQSPGTGSRGQYLDASGGQAYNIAAVVPGADHPEETVLVSGHYDFTDSGPAAAWDSAEGHTEVMRMAYLMADYWRKTDTRPSATVKFIPWDSEESGTHGSADYVRNNIPPGEEDEVRAYFNVDPCAGAYPAFNESTAFLQQVSEVMQLADPSNFPEDADSLPNDPNDRIEGFNARAETIVDEVFEYLDDTITTPTGERHIFVADSEAAALGVPSQRDKVVTAVGGLLIFSSDYRNFEAVGIPIFNLFPDYFGPHADLTPASSEGISILHTPNDNLTRINRLTSGLTSPGNLPDPTGTFASEGWAKGMEMCAQVESWYMLQPEMAGTQTSTSDVVAYFEALPNEAIQAQNVTFDAGGSYQYADISTRTLQPDSALTYTWDFGDGSTGTGKVVQHAYPDIGRYNATLTVTGVGGSTDTMIIPITVIGSNFAGPVLHAIDPGDASDGNFGLSWDFTATRDGFDHFRVEESNDFTTLFSDDAETMANWTVTPASDPRVQPWQASDSETVKFRGNQQHSGQRSFWTGLSPSDFNPGVQSDRSILTLNTPIAVPAEGEPQLSYWSIFQNEGDDQGRVEVALTDGTTPPSELDWQAVDVIQAVNTALGQEDYRVCDPSRPDEVLALGFENRAVSLAGFKGKQILVRFNYSLGAENRALSQPCGWYVDEIRVASGTFQSIGTTTAQTFQVTGKTNGTYAYRVIGVYNDGVSTAASNVETAEVNAAQQPDLMVSDIVGVTNKNVREGQKVTVTATITNQGNAGAGPSKTEFLLDGTTVLGLVDTATVAAGGSTQVSVQWDTRNTKGEHTIKVTADKTTMVTESAEGNNVATRTVTVQGNKVKNGSFEQANEAGTGPASWSSSNSKAGTTSWSDSGVDGSKAASARGTGGNAARAGSPTWTSEPVDVGSGQSLTLVVSVNSRDASSAPRAGLTYLGAAGNVLDTVTLVMAPLTTIGFETFERTVTIPAGVAKVRVVLSAFAPTDIATFGSVNFDNVGLYGS